MSVVCRSRAHRERWVVIDVRPAVLLRLCARIELAPPDIGGEGDILLVVPRVVGGDDGSVVTSTEIADIPGLADVFVVVGSIFGEHAPSRDTAVVGDVIRRGSILGRDIGPVQARATDVEEGGVVADTSKMSPVLGDEAGPIVWEEIAAPAHVCIDHCRLTLPSDGGDRPMDVRRAGYAHNELERVGSDDEISFRSVEVSTRDPTFRLSLNVGLTIYGCARSKETIRRSWVEPYHETRFGTAHSLARSKVRP